MSGSSGGELTPHTNQMEARDARRGGWFWDFHEVFTRPIPLHAKVVRLFLAHCVNKEERAWPSLETIAKGCGISRAAVARALKYLVEHGWLECIPRAAGYRGLGNVYVLKNPPAEEPENVAMSGTEPVGVIGDASKPCLMGSHGPIDAPPAAPNRASLDEAAHVEGPEPGLSQTKSNVGHAEAFSSDTAQGDTYHADTRQPDNAQLDTSRADLPHVDTSHCDMSRADPSPGNRLSERRRTIRYKNNNQTKEDRSSSSPNGEEEDDRKGRPQSETNQDPAIPNDRTLIAELTGRLHELPGVKKLQGHYGMVGRAFKEYGYEVVSAAIEDVEFWLIGRRDMGMPDISERELAELFYKKCKWNWKDPIIQELIPPEKRGNAEPPKPKTFCFEEAMANKEIEYIPYPKGISGKVIHLKKSDSRR